MESDVAVPAEGASGFVVALYKSVDEIESDDVSHLFDEERIGRKFEVPRSVWFYTKEREVPLHGALADVGPGGDAPHTPVGGVVRPFLKHGTKQPGDSVFIVGTGPAGTGCVIQTGEAILM